MSRNSDPIDSHRDSHRDAPGTPDSSSEGILERNLERLLTRADDAPTMDPAARVRVLESLERRVTRRREISPGRSSDSAAPWTCLQAWPAGAAFAAVACVAAVWWLVASPGSHGDGGFQPRTVVTDTLPQATILADGTEIVSNRDTRVTVTGPRAIRIDAGDVLLDVARGDTPFVVDAPHGRVVVLGTRFVVNARADHTLASVVRGRVQIENRRGQARLSAGEQGVLRPDAAPVRRRAPRLSHLAGWAQKARRAGDAGERTDRTIRSGALIARNPGWPGQDHPLPMRELSVDVHVEDRVARVAIDQTFFNAQDWQLEGVYRFPLPPGAAISRLAMYVAGQRMEAAIVDRQRGRQIYESIVYRRRDPALLEWMAGNEFKVRIFPLPARQEKRIVLSYTQTLDRLYDDYQLAVPIPTLEHPVDRVRYRVRLADCARCDVHSTSHEIALTRDGDDAVVTFERDGHRIGDDLLLTVREPDSGPLIATFDQGDASYVMVRATPEFGPFRAGDRAEDLADGPSATPRRWVILHDTSASRGPLERKAQRFFIERLLDEIDETDQVNLIAFDATARVWSPSFVSLSALDRDSLAAFFTEQSSDGIGHTDLEGALRQAMTLFEQADRASDDATAMQHHILYVGDGIVTGGDRDQAALESLIAGRATFVAATIGNTQGAHRLRALTAATGGMLTATRPGDDLAWRAFDLVAALDTPRAVQVRARLLDAAGEPMPEIVAYPSKTALADGEELLVVARSAAATLLPAALEVEGVVAGRPWRQRVELSPASGASVRDREGEARYLPRLWAQRRIDELMTRSGGERSEQTRQEIAALGKKHFLMTPYTSLLVLENDAMYAQHRVRRDRTPAWAPYRLPDRIPVVREPRGSLVSPGDSRGDSAIDPRIALVRTPGAILQSSPDLDHHAWIPRQAPWSGVLAIRGARAIRGGAVWGSLLGDQVGEASGAAGAGVTVDRTGTTSPTAASDPPGAVGFNQPPAGAVITSEALQTRTTTWSSNKTLEKNPGIRAGGELGIRRESGRIVAPGQGQGRGQSRRTVAAGRLGVLGYWGRGDLGWLGHGARVVATLHPVALHYHSDPRLDDLSDFVPGLFDTAIDHRGRALRGQDSAPGSITEQARQLVARARAGQGGVTYRSPDGQLLTIASDGQLVIERTLSSGLRERVSYDGADLVHDYPELAVATRRRARDLVAVILDEMAPFWLPSADDLARWYHVDRSGPRTLTLRRGGPARHAHDAAGHIEIVLDQALRVVEIRSVTSAGAVAQRRFEYTEKGLVMIIPGEPDARPRDRRVELSRQTGIDAGADRVTAVPAGHATVEIPLRQPAYWTEAIARLDPGSPGWRRAQIQLLASQAALGQAAALWQTAQAIHEEAGNLSPGEWVLASRGVRAVTRRPVLSAALAGIDHPVAAYLLASHRSARQPDPAAFDALVAERERAGEPSLLAMLGRYRGALAAITHRGHPRRARTRAVEFMARYPDTLMAYILAFQYNAYFQWQSPKNAASLWDALAAGRWRSVARFEAARVFAGSGSFDEAVRRFEQILESDDELRPDGLVHTAFVNSARGPAGWRALWIRWRDRALASGRPERITDVLRAAVATGQRGDVDRAVARATSLQLRDAHQTLALARALVVAGHRQAALTVLEPVLRGDAPGDAAGTAGAADDTSVDTSDDVPRGDAATIHAAHDLAGRIAHDMGHHERAARQYQRAMEVAEAGGMTVELATLRQEYGRLITLWGKVAQARAGADRERALGDALRAVAGWRTVDPGNPEIDRQAATLLYSVDRPEQAWRHLSTAIERAPMEGESYRVVADALEQQGQLERAGMLWQRASEVERTNPTWLLRRAQVLVSLGERDDARSLLRTITRTMWHERFDRVTAQARDLAGRLSRNRADSPGSGD